MQQPPSKASPVKKTLAPPSKGTSETRKRSNSATEKIKEETKDTHNGDAEFLKLYKEEENSGPFSAPASPSQPAHSHLTSSGHVSNTSSPPNSRAMHDKILLKLIKKFKPAYPSSPSDPTSPVAVPDATKSHVPKIFKKHRTAVSPALWWRTITELVERGANVNIQNKNGKTALMYACLYGDFELVKYLLLHNANPWLEDKKGKNCVEYAIKGGQHQIKQFVSSWMKTNKPESMKIYLNNSADLKPFLQQSFAIPKELQGDLSPKQYSDFVALLREALAQDALKKRKYVQSGNVFVRNEETRTFNILSIDGGGVKCLFAAKVVQKLWELLPGLMDRVDMIIGGSGGAVVAAGLAHGLTPQFISDFYEEGAKRTFSEKRMGIHRAKYSRKWMKLGYYLILGNTRMKDLQKKLFIPAWKLEDEHGEWGPKYFHNLKHGSGMEDSVIDILLRSSAAPVFFPSYQGYIDCGVYANNPLHVALPFIIGQHDDSLNIPLEKVRVFSIGNGVTNFHIKEDSDGESDWGLIQWGPQMIKLLFEGQAKLAEKNSISLLGDKFWRVAPRWLERGTGLDDIEVMNTIKERMGEVDLNAAAAWIDKNFK